MNIHPVLSSYRTQMHYASIWMVVIIIQAIFNWHVGVPFGFALTDSALFGMILACCLLFFAVAVLAYNLYSNIRERLLLTYRNNVGMQL